jgi:hypothetical protein
VVKVRRLAASPAASQRDVDSLGETVFDLQCQVAAMKAELQRAGGTLAELQAEVAELEATRQWIEQVRGRKMPLRSSAELFAKRSRVLAERQAKAIRHSMKLRARTERALKNSRQRQSERQRRQK